MGRKAETERRMNDSILDQLPWGWRVTGQVEACEGKRGRVEERKMEKRGEEEANVIARIQFCGTIALSGAIITCIHALATLNTPGY